MKGINYVVLGGNLGKDPEVRFLQNGIEVASFNLAVNEKWKTNSGDMKERTDWFKIVAYKNLADVCKNYLSAGDSVIVSGRLTTREWDDKENGQKRRSTEVVINNLSFVKIKKRGNIEDKGPGIDDDVPF